ncbi:hypothetical protein B0A49_07047 [Cryomyces minteri]|uniref:A-kinase anchor protein 7-like phosphoesterase domain-containing protein n=1 Tax=Cryomyces minteri TaxID=331657 RepID=A0A4U0X1A9_9PEZI|nr:hypothetical protein B0A49_07047 [Cryomyces minteri]
MSLDEAGLTRAIELLRSINTAELLEEVGLEGARPTAISTSAESRLEDQDRGAAVLDSTHISTISSLPAVNPLPTSASDPSASTTPHPSPNSTTPIFPPPITPSVFAPVPTATPALLSIVLNSLHSMHSPCRTSILYAIPTDPTNRLHAFASRIRSLFTDADLLVPDDRPLKLHATIVNTIYAKGVGRKRPGRVADSSSNGATSEGSVADSTADVRPEPAREDQQPQQNDRAEGHGPHSRAPIRLDARELMNRYKGFVWAQDVAVEKVAVCKMGARKVVDERGRVVDEVYEEVGSVAVVGR